MSYVKVYVALLLLTATTVGAAFLPLGPFSPLLALAIAGGKAGLVAVGFMHLRGAPRAAWAFAAGGLLCFVLLLVPLIVDLLTRDLPR